MTVKISVMKMNQTCQQTIVEFEFNRESEGERENLRLYLCKAVVFLVYASLYISKSTQVFRGTAGPDRVSSHNNMCILLIFWSCCTGRYASQLTVKYLICQLLHNRSPLQLCNARGGWLHWKSKDLTFLEILRSCFKMTGKCHNLKQGGGGGEHWAWILSDCG